MSLWAVCLAGLAGLAPPTPLAERITLAWTHSIEKVEWQEDYRATAAGLALDEARVQGSGAGMEPGPDARFDGHWWRWHPALPSLPELRLADSGATADWRLCWDGTCRELGALRPRSAIGEPARLVLCQMP